MNWPTSITLFFIVFAGSMTAAVITSTKHAPQMVQKDYYALDIEYQAQMDKKYRTAALPALPVLKRDSAQQWVITLPAGMQAVSGTAKCYRSATTKDDAEVRIAHATPTIVIPSAQFQSGRWHLDLDWTDQNGLSYFWTTTFYQ
jgi:hypothetical protein